MMNIIIRNIPNSITSLNLISGIAGILCAFSGRLELSFLLMLAAMVVLGFYTDSKKKHQARIFELKRTLAMEKGKNPDGDNSQQS